jgi:hypothetical protein
MLPETNLSLVNADLLQEQVDAGQEVAQGLVVDRTLPYGLTD